MKPGMKICLMLIMLPAIFTGCRQTNTASKAEPSVRVVTQIDVFCLHQGTTLQRHYTHARKMEHLLNYLRLLKNYGNLSKNPENYSGNQCTIILQLSDGSQNRYYQQDYTYQSKNQIDWHRTDTKLAKKLPLLLYAIDSDA